MLKMVMFSYCRVLDWFELDLVQDLIEQCKLCGQLEQIDYIVFVVNQVVIKKMIYFVMFEDFQNFVLFVFKVCSVWVDVVMFVVCSWVLLEKIEVEWLGFLCDVYEELFEVYDVMCCMVECGYL